MRIIEQSGRNRTGAEIVDVLEFKGSQQRAANNNTAQADCARSNNKEHGGLWSMRSRVSSWLVLGVCVVAFVAIIVIELI